MLKVFEDTFESLGGIWEGAAEISIDTEISIPDYQPQIFKIVKSMIQPVILQKNVSGTRAHLEGYLRCVVFYQADSEEGLCRTEQKYPFERTLELPDESFAGTVMETAGSTEYLNCRAVNQRRIEVRGTYSISCRMAGRQEVSVITALADEGIEQRIEKLAYSRMAGNLDKLITGEEEIHLPDDLQSIIDISGVSRINEKKLLGGKAVIKGQTTCKILYTVHDDSSLHQMDIPVAFNQIVDIDCLKEDSCCAVKAETIGCTVTSGSDGASILTVTTMLRIAVHNPVHLEAVADCFSTLYHIESETKSFSAEEILYEQRKDSEFTSSALLPGGDCIPLGCLCQVQPPAVEERNGSPRVSGFAVVSMFYRNSLQELACMDTTVPYYFDLEDARAEHFCGTVQAETVSFRKNDANIEVTVSLAMDGMLTARQNHMLISKAAVSDPWEKEDDIALRIYYGHNNESVFNIAKQYHAKPKDLALCNDLQTDILPKDQHILIPSAY